MRTNLAYAINYDDGVESSLAEASAPLNQKTILIIEDDQILSQTIKRFAEKYFDRVLIFECAEKASNYLNNSPIKIDLALIDYFLPGQNGADFAKKISKKNPNGRLFLMSGNLEHIQNNESLNNFEDFLAKPLSLQKIKQIIES